MIQGLPALLVGAAWVPIALSDGVPARSVAWIDVEGDGDPDVVVSRGISGRVLWTNDGRGQFAPSQPDVLAAQGLDGVASVWADADDDGDADAYLVNAGGGRLVRNDGATFAEVATPPAAAVGDGQAACWGDYDSDGDLDLFVANRGSPGALLRNDGAGAFADVTAPPLDGAALATSADWVDVDGDRDPDLYVVAYGANRLFRNDGDSFQDATAGPLGDAAAGSGASWGDWDDDGDLDVHLASLGRSRLLRNDGACVFADVTPAPLAEVGFAAGSTWEDADSDGDLDLYVAVQGGPSRWLRNDGGAFADATAPPLDGPGGLLDAAWGDADGNGSPDLFLVDAGGAGRLLLNFAAEGNHWIDVQLVGTVSNVSAIGARVRIMAGEASRTRWVTSGGGARSHGSRVLHFGLGDARAVDGIEVVWPSGILQTIAAPRVDARLVVVERDPADASDSSRRGTALAASPDPFRFTTTISWELAVEGTAELAVLDRSGRLVRTLLDGAAGAGPQARLWNGRDDRGVSTPPGLYFVRLEAGARRETQRIVKRG
jgi:hypothetical protein